MAFGSLSSHHEHGFSPKRPLGCKTIPANKVAVGAMLRHMAFAGGKIHLYRLGIVPRKVPGKKGYYPGFHLYPIVICRLASLFLPILPLCPP